MNPTLGPSEAVFYYRFSGEDCLYRDHRGRRVIADLEGAGVFCIEEAEPPVLTFADERQSDMFQGSYLENLTVVALRPGAVSVHAMRGRQAPPEGISTQVSLPY